MTYIVRRDRLSGVEAETYAASRVGSELDVPIFTGDEWVGLVGSLSEDEQRDWSGELPLMETLGSLLVARFERRGLPPTVDT